MKTLVSMKCAICNGNKIVRKSGGLRVTCDACDGKGKQTAAIAKDETADGTICECPHCLGSGKIWNSEEIKKALEPPVEPPTITPITPLTKKKRGRPKRK
jgi:DnaJ-class molecular chaperone